MNISVPDSPSGVPCIRNFKSIKNGLTFRKLGPIVCFPEGKVIYRNDALIVKDGQAINQLMVHSDDGPVGKESMQELRRAAWQIFRSHGDNV